MVTSRNSWFQPWFVVGSIFGFVGAVLFHFADEATSDARIYGYSILIGFGAGCFVTLCFATAQTQVPNKAEIPQAVAFMAFAQQGGAAVTLAISNSMFLNIAIQKLGDILPQYSRATIQRILSGVGTDILNSLSKADSDRVSQTIAASISKAYIVPIICGGLAVIFSVFIKRDRDWEKRVKAKVFGPREPTHEGNPANEGGEQFELASNK
jgi:drug/metabolite transporter (DMT)-like permease